MVVVVVSFVCFRVVCACRVSYCVFFVYYVVLVCLDVVVLFVRVF